MCFECFGVLLQLLLLKIEGSLPGKSLSENKRAPRIGAHRPGNSSGLCSRKTPFWGSIGSSAGSGSGQGPGICGEVQKRNFRAQILTAVVPMSIQPTYLFSSFLVQRTFL